MKEIKIWSREEMDLTLFDFGQLVYRDWAIKGFIHPDFVSTNKKLSAHLKVTRQGSVSIRVWYES